ncbi:MAG: hypothetical protein KGJ06_09240, partial [Pseudomonadota bacterium]|nr:hypothetical protein [Pseudomonadota bacterium]
FATTPEQLDFLRFPLGHLKSKDETRQLAARFGLEVADKPDSQDICFVPTGGYAKVIEKLRPGALEPGEIVHMDGTVIGCHDGIINYTVGQRKGLGIAAAEPLYVIRLDAAKKQVIVGPKEALLVRSFIIRECNWLSSPPPIGGRPGGGHDSPNTIRPHPNPLPTGEGIIVKLRSAHPGTPAHIELLDGNRARIRFREPQGAVSPGQACVAYDGDRLLGGGWIAAEALE